MLIFIAIFKDHYGLLIAITTTEVQRNYEVFTISDETRDLFQYVLILNSLEAVKHVFDDSMTDRYKDR